MMVPEDPNARLNLDVAPDAYTDGLKLRLNQDENDSRGID